MYCQIMVVVMQSSCYWHFMIMFRIPDCYSCLKVIFSYTKRQFQNCFFKIALSGYWVQVILSSSNMGFEKLEEISKSFEQGRGVVTKGS